MQISVICMGIKASGKSTRALAFVRLCLERNYYDEYFLFLPAYSKDIHGSYRWLQLYKDKVVIFTEYRPEFAEMLLDITTEQVAKNEKGTLIFMDDLGCLVGEKPGQGFGSGDPHFFSIDWAASSRALFNYFKFSFTCISKGNFSLPKTASNALLDV